MPESGAETEKNLCSLLVDLECAMRRAELWASRTPSADALASVQPFAVDTLSFPQWLQFIFIVKLKDILHNQLPLPKNSAVAAMGEEYFRGLPVSGAEITQLLKKMDTLLSLS